MMMQFQADMLGIDVVRPENLETTALGAAFLAGLAVGFWKDKADIAALWAIETRFQPTLGRAQCDQHYRGWQRAVERARAWAEET